jgi:hypothetical protein
MWQVEGAMVMGQIAVPEAITAESPIESGARLTMRSPMLTGTHRQPSPSTV